MNDKEYCLHFKKNIICNPKNYGDARTVYIFGINSKGKAENKHTTIKPLDFIINMK